MTSSVILGQDSSLCFCLDPSSTRKPLNLLKTMEKASAVALGLFSLKSSPLLFVASFLFGAFVGLSQKSDSSDNHAHIHSGCSAEFIEKITETRAPPVISLFAAFAITYCHIDHHTRVFVPIIGFHLGMAAGHFFKERAYQVI